MVEKRWTENIVQGTEGKGSELEREYCYNLVGAYRVEIQGEKIRGRTANITERREDSYWDNKNLDTQLK